MMNKEDLIRMVNDTLEKCNGKYDWMISDAVNVFYDEKYFKVDVIKKFTSNIKVNMLKKTTVDAIIENSDKVYAVLNFASAKHPGGGVLKGTVAQEEALARASSLYPVIKNCDEFYTTTYSSYYTDKIIYSKPIYVFKNDYGQDVEPVECDVITCAAPNYSFCNFNLGVHMKVMTERFTKVLMSAIANNRRNLILGAWGCGVFSNPADINAKIFLDVLNNYSSFFDEVIFAIPDNKNFEIFKEVFEKS